MIRVTVKGDTPIGANAVATVIADALRCLRLDVHVDMYGELPKSLANAKLVARGLRDRRAEVSTGGDK